MNSAMSFRPMLSHPAVVDGIRNGTPARDIKGFLLIEGALDSVPEIEYAASRLMWVEEVHRLDGPYDLLVAICVPDGGALNDLVDSLSALDGTIVVRVIHRLPGTEASS